MGALVVTVAFAVILAGAGWRSVQIWRDSTSDLDGFPEWMLRAFPTAVVTVTAVSVGGVLVHLVRGDRDSTPLSEAIGVVSALGFGVGLGLVVSTAVRARPARLVPPHLRRR